LGVRQTKLGQLGYAVSEELGGWVGRFDTAAIPIPTPIAVANESAGDTQAKNLPKPKTCLASFCTIA
jgi:hypothetical protein